MSSFLSEEDMEQTFSRILIEKYTDTPGGYLAFIRDNPWAFSNDYLASLILPSWNEPTFKTNSNAQSAMKNFGIDKIFMEHWKPRRLKDNTHIIKGFIKFLVKDYLNINLDEISGKDFLSIFNKHNTEKNLKEEKWIQRYETNINMNLLIPFDKTSEYTKYSHCLYHYYPGKDWMSHNNIDPLMFNHAVRKTEISENRFISLLEKVYLFHSEEVQEFVGRPRHDEKYITEAKLALVNDPSFFKFSFLKNYISVKTIDNLDGSFASLKLQLANLFKDDLESAGCNVKSTYETWSKNKFLLENPIDFYKKCMLTNSRHVDYHHLLPKSNFPQYIYDPNNIVPLNYGFHMWIHRKALAGEFRDLFKKRYDKCIENWINLYNKSRHSIDIFKPILLDMKKKYDDSSGEDL